MIFWSTAYLGKSCRRPTVSSLFDLRARVPPIAVLGLDDRVPAPSRGSPRSCYDVVHRCHPDARRRGGGGPAHPARDTDRRRMGCALPCSIGLGCRGPTQPGDPGSGLCPDGTLCAGSPRSLAEPDNMEDPRAGSFCDAGLLARHGTNSTVPAGYLAKPPAERVLSCRLGPAADRGFATQLFVFA